VTKSIVSGSEDLGMFTPPSRATLPIFTDNHSKPHARATVAVLAALTQLITLLGIALLMVRR